MSNVKVKFEDNSKRILSESDRKVNMILTAIGQKAVTIWKKIITTKKIVDTGTFRNKCNFEVDNNSKSVIIGNPVEYAEWLEIGTKKMKARPSLKPTILEHKSDYQKLATQLWEQ